MIIIDTQTFALHQDIIVFNDNKEILTRTKASIKNIPEVVTQLAETHQVYDIKLMGNKKFNEKIREKIINCYISKYNIDRLKVQVI